MAVLIVTGQSKEYGKYTLMLLRKIQESAESIFFPKE